MKDQTIITFAFLSLFTIVVPAANADTNSSTTITKESAPTTRFDASVKTESASVPEASDPPVYADSLKKDDIIEKHKQHVLISDVKRRPWL
jgi:hypothetical protein